jgi:hypothetical protein
MLAQGSIPQCTSRARICPDMKRPATFWPKPVREGRLVHCRVLGDIIPVPRVVPVLSLERATVTVGKPAYHRTSAVLL